MEDTCVLPDAISPVLILDTTLRLTVQRHGLHRRMRTNIGTIASFALNQKICRIGVMQMGKDLSQVSALQYRQTKHTKYPR